MKLTQKKTRDNDISLAGRQQRGAVKVDAQMDLLVNDMNRSTAETEKFIQSMEKEPT